jgi:hypothetical protein
LSLHKEDEEHNVKINWYVETIDDANGEEFCNRVDTWFGTAANITEIHIYGRDGTIYERI